MSPLSGKPFDKGDKVIVTSGTHATKRGTVIQRRSDAGRGCALLVEAPPIPTFLGWVPGEKFLVDPLRCSADR